MLRRDRASAGDLKTQAASPQWQRSRAAEQAAETEKVRERRGGFLFFFLFFVGGRCKKKVLTQIAQGDAGGLGQVDLFKRNK